jgi:hypothetical protein
MNSVFNLPQGITTVGTYFCYYMFYGCYGNAFQVNSVFKFPLLSLTELGKTDVFYRTFYTNTNKTYVRQNRTALSIINGNTPDWTTSRQTFYMYNGTQGANRWSDWDEIPANWK